MVKEGAELLAQAIIVQACKDYRSSLKALKKNCECGYALKQKDDLEEFFRSEWYEILTRLDGERLIHMLKEEMQYDG